LGATVHPSAHRLGWHSILPPTSPGARNRLGFVYDPADNYSVMYGGYTGVGFYNDTYSYAGGKWTKLSPTKNPTAPTGLRLVYDPAFPGVLAFGGEKPYGAAYYNDTWVFHAGNWTQLHPKVSPPARSQYAMAYDVVDAEVVLFGGYDGSNDLADTWTFNGTTWAPAYSANVPMGREQATMVYDGVTAQTLMFGGWNKTSGGPTHGTWMFRGGHWKMLTSTNTPLRSWTPATTLPNGTPIFFGGEQGGASNLLNSTFEFYGGAWHWLPLRGAPAQRANEGLTYDARDGYVVMFGGVGNYVTFLNDTWKLS
jgi:hypothetical protein